ncbi:MAG: hypothetical protein Q7R94_03260 [bacterium]|nr:hypothetical protein [bacterium]
MKGEKFLAAEMAELKQELINCGLDYKAATESIQLFLAARGYGVSIEEAKNAAESILPHAQKMTSEDIRKQLDSISREM